MKQKVVIKLSVHDCKDRTKAMKTAVGVHGVNSASLQPDKDQLEVTGEGVDVVRLATLLRKSLKYAEVVSVNPVDEKKKDEKKEPEAPPFVIGCPQYMMTACPPPCQDYPDNICSIL